MSIDAVQKYKEMFVYPLRHSTVELSLISTLKQRTRVCVCVGEYVYVFGNQWKWIPQSCQSLSIKSLSHTCTNFFSAYRPIIIHVVIHYHHEFTIIFFFHLEVKPNVVILYVLPTPRPRCLVTSWPCVVHDQDSVLSLLATLCCHHVYAIKKKRCTQICI